MQSCSYCFQCWRKVFCDCVDRSLSLDTDFASTALLERRQLLQIRCKFGMPRQNCRVAEAVLTVTLTQYCQRFNTQFLHWNTEFYQIPLLLLHFHIHAVTNAQLWQHESKFLGLNCVLLWLRVTCWKLPVLFHQYTVYVWYGRVVNIAEEIPNMFVMGRSDTLKYR